MTNMRVLTINLIIVLAISFANALDCPPDTAWYTDLDTTSATYGDSISTGLCACLGFADISGDASTLTLPVLLYDNEPIRAFQFEIFDNSDNALTLDSESGASVVVGDKIQGWTIAFTETDLGSALIFGFSLSGDTTQAGEEGILIEVNFAITGALGNEIQFYLGGGKGVKLSDMDVQNVACNFPDVDNPVTFSTDFLVVAEEKLGMPEVFALNQNYPNPFNPITTIKFQLVENSFVELNIYNLLGQKVTSLVNRTMPTGYHKVQWDGRNQYGDKAASGIYIYTIKTDKFFDQKKMLLLQ